MFYTLGTPHQIVVFGKPLFVFTFRHAPNFKFGNPGAVDAVVFENSSNISGGDFGKINDVRAPSRWVLRYAMLLWNVDPLPLRIILQVESLRGFDSLVVLDEIQFDHVKGLQNTKIEFQPICLMGRADCGPTI